MSKDITRLRETAMRTGPDAPILFIHYGRSAYLRRTLAAARRSNPRKRIVLLGDDTNRDMATGLAEFCDYRTCSLGAKAHEFASVFQAIEGDQHHFNKPGGTASWLRFVFLRWFCLEEFVRNYGIASFWTFDSDTLLLADLLPREARYSAYEATVQCRGNCLNGWIGSLAFVERYTDCILDLFGDDGFLASQRARLEVAKGLAFTEMDAFAEFRRRQNPRVRHAAEPLRGEAFDDALAIVRGFEMSPAKVLGRTTVKRLWSTPSGGLYGKTAPDGNPFRMLSCNMSWMPDYVWRRLRRFVLAPEQDEAVIADRFCEVSLLQPWPDKVLGWLVSQRIAAARILRAEL